MNGGLVRLREHLSSLPNSEKIVAEYIINQPESVIGLSVAELSRLSGGSQAAIIRMCKSIGVKGYKELILQIAGDLREIELKNDYREIKNSDTIPDIVRGISQNNIQSIQDTLKIIDISRVEQAVGLLNKAKRIFFYGIGASNLIAADAQHKFMRINKTCFSFQDPDQQLTSSVMLTKHDVAVGISYSGQTSTVFTCLQSAKATGTPTISITKYANTPIGSLTDVPLYVSAMESEVRSAAMASRIAQLNMIDILYIGVVTRSLKQSVNYLQMSRDIVTKK